MLSPFLIHDKNLYLDRFPINQVNRSLQAWDASDEYLINYITQQQLIKPDSKVFIFNDNFGALSLNFTKQHVVCISDSYIAQQGLKHNAVQNGLTLENHQLLSSLEPLPDSPNIVLYKIPKSNHLLIEQLTQISKIATNETTFIAADKAKNIQSSTLKLFEKHYGDTKTSLAVKKARLVFCQNNLSTSSTLTQQFNQTKSWPLENTALTITNYANVFAREKLDIGARLFLQHLPKVNDSQKVIDLGCGNGVVGLSLLNAQPNCHVQFVDESYMAVQSAKENVQKNFPDSVQNCQFIVNDCLTDVPSNSVDLILCNPPFHQQNATTDHIAWQMFKDSFRVLKKGGELRIVGNRQLGYHIKLQRIFNNEKLISSNKKFVILSAIKK